MTDKFNPQSKITKVQGKDYLTVQWRLVWFRSDHPKGTITTEVVGDDLMKATILDSDGKVLATGHGSSKKAGVAKSRPFEGAETAAIGRALAHAGYGTQFAGDEFDEGDHLADSPVEKQDPTVMNESEKQRTVIEMYATLVKRAKAVNITIPALDAGLSSAEMKKQYQEQYKFVHDAEDQAKAGE